MATIGQNFREFLLAESTITAITQVIAQSTVPQPSVAPYVWFRRSGEDREKLLDGTIAFIRTRIDVEAVSGDIDQAIALADAIRDALDTHQGAFGQDAVKLVLVEDKDDDYVVINNSDDGLHVIALDVLVIE